MSKAIKEICKKIDEEGYYKTILEKDLGHFKWFKRKQILKVVSYLLHMTGVHHELQKTKTIHIQDYGEIAIFSCPICKFECTEKGLNFQIVKYFGTVIVFLGLLAFVPWDLLGSIKLIGFILWFYFLIIHLFAGLYSLIQNC